METRTVQVPSIHCGNCTRTIQNELSDLDGVAKVTADPGTKQVTVEFGPPTRWADIADLLDEIGFPAAT
jgi:copper chaperone CopZ